MRLDKFLQVSRLIRRRALANSLCHAGRVTLNGRPATPATPVRPDDILTVEFGARRLRARVRAIPTGRHGEDECVELLEDHALE